jgi:hypothetical protein
VKPGRLHASPTQGLDPKKDIGTKDFGTIVKKEWSAKRIVKQTALSSFS